MLGPFEESDISVLENIFKRMIGIQILFTKLGEPAVHSNICITLPLE